MYKTLIAAFAATALLAAPADALAAKKHPAAKAKIVKTKAPSAKIVKVNLPKCADLNREISNNPGRETRIFINEARAAGRCK